MSDLAGFVTISHSNSHYFYTVSNNDMLLYPETSNQRIFLGTKSNSAAALEINSNSIKITGDVNFTGALLSNGVPYSSGTGFSTDGSNLFVIGSNIAVGKSNPDFPLDVVGDLNFTGMLRQNGVPYVGSQWSNDSANVFLLGSNVGLGLSNPTKMLDVNGDVYFRSNIFTQNQLQLRGMRILPVSNNSMMNVTTTVTSIPNLSNNPEGLVMNLNSNNANASFRIQNTSAELVRMTGAGNFGINTTSPAFKLDVNGQSRTKELILSNASLTSTGNDVYISTNGASTVYIRPNGSNSSIMQSVFTSTYTSFASNVGINTTNPLYSLDVAGISQFRSNAIHSDDVTIRSNNSVWSSLAGRQIYMKYSTNNGEDSAYIQSVDRSTVKYFNMGIEASNLSLGSTSSNVYIQYDGNVGVGKSNPSYKLDVVGDINFTGTLMNNGTSFGGGFGWSNFSSGTIFTTSNVGINTSSPSVALDVNGSAKISTDLEVLGNFSVRGTTTSVETTTVNIKDNIIRLNNGASYLASLQAGIEVNRGATYSNYYILFDEASQFFKVGTSPGLQTLATREDSPSNFSIPYFDATSNKYTFCNAFTFSNGNLGIGLSNPTNRLHVKIADATDGWTYTVGSNNVIGAITANRSSAAGAYSFVKVENDCNNGAVFYINSSKRSADGPVNCATLRNDIGDLRLLASNSVGLYVQSTTGNIGIGTTNPLAHLDVAGNIKCRTLYSSGTTEGGELQLLNPNDNVSGWVIDNYAPQANNNSLRIFYNSNGSFEAMYFHANSNVGINTNLPQAKLHIAADSALGAVYAGSLYAGDPGCGQLWITGATDNTKRLALLYDTTSNIGCIQSMRLNVGSSPLCLNAGGGNVGIGTTTPAYKLDVAGTINFTGSLLQNGVAFSSTVPAASTTAAGIVQLNDTVSSTSTTLAATASAVKTAYDTAFSAQSTANTASTNASSALTTANTANTTANTANTTANAALPKSGGTMTGNLSVPSITVGSIGPLKWARGVNPKGSPAGTTNTISFGITFSSVPTVTCTAIVNSTDSPVIHIRTITTTGFTAHRNYYVQGNGGSTGVSGFSDEAFHWFAIGPA